MLMTMPDEKLIGVIGRVLADKSEEKRTAGLDMVLQLKKKHSPCLQSALKAVESITDPSTKESILIKEIVGEEKAQKGKAFGYGLYDVNASYEPILESSYLEKCKMQFQKTFGPSADASLELQILKELDDLIGQNKEREYQTFCGTKLLGDFVDLIRVDGKMQLPFPEIWEAFYQNHIRTTEELLRLKVLLTNMITRDNRVRGVCDHFKPILREIFGEDMWLDNLGELKRLWHYYKIIGQLAEEKLSPRILADYAAYLAYCLAVHKKELDYQYTAADLNNEWECRGTDPGVTFSISIVFFGAVGYLLGYMKDSKEGFPYFYNLAKQNQFDYEEDSGLAYKGKDTKYYLQPADYISACAAGFISEDFLLKTLMDENMRKETLSSLSDVVIYVRETGKTMASKGYVYYWKIRHQKEIMQRLLGKELPEKKTDMEYDEQDRKVIVLALDCFEKISRVILDVELTRGDTATEFSGQITCLNRLYGVEYLVRILAALGKETLDRNNYWGQVVSKRSCLSHLLKCCMPDYREGDQKQQAEKLAALIKGTDIGENRLIEACLFTPEWIDIVGTYLGWDGFTSGCYYFIAHMNEKFSEDKMALIARYTPLSEKELNSGAFDRNWFEEVYDQLGKKRFDMIYSAAKYISDGSRHTRARKYADAARGEMDAQKVKEEIEAKRNKDLLMAYGLIPGTEKEICERYEFIRKFEKESGRFGAQRRAAEKLAAEMAIKNMATAAGYSDETGFILKMEGMVSSGREACWEPHAVGEYLVHLAMDENGRIDLVIQKGGKKLSSVPAVIKKEEYLVNLQEAKKTL
ncbi:MAG: hypothetical protein J6Z35_07030, partial [Lachnospiraceae bacterium]|nr:hypothetical protein [Lachnospiraceae bacterium]